MKSGGGEQSVEVQPRVRGTEAGPGFGADEVSAGQGGRWKCVCGERWRLPGAARLKEWEQSCPKAQLTRGRPEIIYSP